MTIRWWDPLIDAVDAWQRQHTPVAFAIGVFKKFSDDRGGNLVALIAYYSFLSVFPLLLILVTVLGAVAGAHPGIKRSILDSAISQFPVVGRQLGDSIQALHRRSVTGVVIGLVGVLWGSFGASRASQHAMADVWDVPRDERPNFGAALVRNVAFLGSMAVFVVASTLMASFASFDGGQNTVLRALGTLGSLGVNCATFVIAFRVLTPRQIPVGQLVVGAITGAIAFTALQVGGGYLVGHELRRASQLYGFFGIVLGTIFWIYLVARITVMAAEVNVVKERHLWPRALRTSDPTEADRRAEEFLFAEHRPPPRERVPPDSGS